MKKLILPAFAFLALPVTSFALEYGSPAVTTTSTETEQTQTDDQMTDAERYQQKVEQRRAYLRTLYRKNYLGRRNTVSDLQIRRYDNSIHSWEEDRETIKSTRNIRANTHIGYKNYGEYLKHVLEVKRLQKAASAKEAREAQRIQELQNQED